MTLEQQVADLTAANTKLTSEVLETKAKATVSADSALLNADRAVAAQGAITDELAQVQALAAQVSEDKANVTSTLIGDEDYIVPAVVKLLGGYTDVVATAVSDDVWAEHAYKWGGPAEIAALVKDNEVFIVDTTKPSAPVWKSAVAGTANAWIAGWRAAIGTANTTLIPSNLVDVQLVGSCLILASGFDGANSSTGSLFIYDFAAAHAWRLGGNSYGSAESGEPFDVVGNSADYWRIATSLKLVDRGVNSVASRIADDAPCHPVSGIPVPTIAVATDGGVSELVPDGEGGWSVSSWPCSTAITGIAYTEDGRLVAASGNWGVTYDLSKVTPGVTISRDVGGLYHYYPVTAALQVGDGGGDRFSAGKTILRTAHFGGNYHLQMISENSSEPAAGMRAYIDEEYATPYLPGDVHCALLCDGEEGVIVGSELVTGGYVPPDGYDTLVTEIDSVSFSMLGQASGQTRCAVSIPTEIGKTYGVKATLDSADLATVMYARAWGGGAGSTLSQAGMVSGEESLLFFTAVSAISSVMWVQNAAGRNASVSGISAYLCTEDRSGRGNHARINGTLNRSKPVGSDISVWSGFNQWGAAGANYLELLNTADLTDDDFSITFHTDAIQDFHMSQRGPTAIYQTEDIPGLAIQVGGATGNKALSVRRFDAVGLHTLAVNAPWPEDSADKFVTVTRQGNAVRIYMNGGERVVSNHDGWLSLPASQNFILNVAHHSGVKFSQVVFSRTVPSPDQIRDIHRLMKLKLEMPSFLTGSVRAVAHDPVRNQDWVACADGQVHRYDGPVIMESVTVPAEVGTISSLTVNDGAIVVGGSADVWLSQAAKNLRASVIQKAKSVQPFELGEGDSVKVDFYLPYGWKPVRAYIDGSKKRQGPQDDWQPMFDGYRWFIRFAVAPGAVDIDCDATEV